MNQRRREHHGGSHTKLYDVWKKMRARCNSPNTPSYPYYGGRGITVCPEWDASFTTFQVWAMSSGYKLGLTLDRIDTNGNYAPDNCRWATWSTQAYNRRSNPPLTAFGETKHLTEWVKDPRCAVTIDSVSRRLRLGLTLEEALTTPPLEARRPTPERPVVICADPEGCPLPASKKGLCHKHYHRDYYRRKRRNA